MPWSPAREQDFRGYLSNGRMAAHTCVSQLQVVCVYVWVCVMGKCSHGYEYLPYEQTLYMNLCAGEPTMDSEWFTERESVCFDSTFTVGSGCLQPNTSFPKLMNIMLCTRAKLNTHSDTHATRTRSYPTLYSASSGNKGNFIHRGESKHLKATDLWEIKQAWKSIAS